LLKTRTHAIFLDVWNQGMGRIRESIVWSGLILGPLESGYTRITWKSVSYYHGSCGSTYSWRNLGSGPPIHKRRQTTQDRRYKQDLRQSRTVPRNQNRVDGQYYKYGRQLILDHSQSQGRSMDEQETHETFNTTATKPNCESECAAAATAIHYPGWRHPDDLHAERKAQQEHLSGRSLCSRYRQRSSTLLFPQRDVRDSPRSTPVVSIIAHHERA
jgi:hypothetical protein